jgi:hypothetical protein
MNNFTARSTLKRFGSINKTFDDSQQISKSYYF